MAKVLYLRVTLLFLMIMVPMLARAGSLSDQQIRKIFSNHTSFASLRGSGKSWNAYWRDDGTVTYWHSNFKINHGTWAVNAGIVCVKLEGLGCREPIPRNDGGFDWVDPKTGKITSTITRFQEADILNISQQRQGEFFHPDIVYDGSKRVFSRNLRWLQTHSFLSLEKALDQTRTLADHGFEHSVIAFARNGWYAVMAGTVMQEDASILNQLKEQRRIPSDSRFATNESYWEMQTFSYASQLANHSGNSSTVHPQSEGQCTEKEYQDLISACDLVFVGEYACNRAFVDGDEEQDLLARTPASSIVCSAAAQLFIDHGIDPIALAMSTAAGLTDEAADQARADGSLSGAFSGAVWNIITAGISAASVGYCYSTVDKKCDR